ncbi:MAG TPA: FAD-binding oxidoreductase [Vicinamibacterales bacterium]|nr:FAD-binding oxidoreductase [Vicinamibacterales bacterium]
MQLTRPVADISVATPRARIVHIDLQGTPFPFAPGQAVWLGAPGQDLRKPYSIASSPEDVARDGQLELLVGLDAAGDSGPHLPLEVGSPVEIDGPVGRFTFPDPPAESRFLFIAGGTGISPLRSMLRHSLTLPHEAIGLMYSARLPEEFAYAGEFRDMAKDGIIELRMTVTRDAGPGHWKGTRGRITREDLQPLVHDGHTLCFVCGPPSLVHEIPKVLQSLGVAPERVRIEEWS